MNIMNLVQNISLDRQSKLSHSLSAPFLAVRVLCEPLSLSFHPFALRAEAAFDDEMFEEKLGEALNISWRFSIVDDDQKPLLEPVSMNRALLLLSEVLLGLTECAEKLGFLLERIEPECQENYLKLTIGIPEGFSIKSLVGGAMIMSTALDSLLFCRGLLVQKTSLEGSFSHLARLVPMLSHAFRAHDKLML